jgi:hypothetical protein
MNHIRDKLPDMKARLNTLMGQAQQELNLFGDAAIFGDKNQVVSFSCSFRDKIVEKNHVARRHGFTVDDSICSRLYFLDRRY